MSYYAGRLALAAGMALLAGCTVYTYEQYGSKNPDQFFGTQPGYHKLSDFFAVDVVGYWISFYYTPPGAAETQYMGVVQVPWFDRSDYGPRQAVFALSQDGRRLLFFDQPEVATKGVGLADLYILDADRGRRELLRSDVHRRSAGCVEFPRHFLPYGVSPTVFNIQDFAVSTEGEEISLDARRAGLIESGNKDKVCGPLFPFEK